MVCVSILRCSSAGENGKLKACWMKKGQLVQFFVNPDEDGAMVSREVLAKQFMEVVQPKLGSKLICVSKAKRTSHVDRKRLGIAHVTGEFAARSDWNTPLCAALGFELSEAEEQFKALVLNEGLSSP